MHKSTLLVSLILGTLGGCRGRVESPHTVVVPFERHVELPNEAGRVALRLLGEDPPRVALNVACDGEDRTLGLPANSLSPVVCGVQFRLVELSRLEPGDPPTAARLELTW